ncbi:NitT/TauT family transport system substrate-binding protein [Rhodoblastus acidophilus]|uniref:ABC transporter substrate-binding protein n=1 Tax=Rhodoblastus acidophilus TaxID=1074 RepID=UPI002224B81A|nr:ABC transporter substrate-binding protein [Rhodoblastus acidophilus]MCW2318185.1 NitT/TauT family transport system substrate-binding protein [Rhodoblastus acidophilus]
MNRKDNFGSRRAFLVGAASVGASVPLGLVGETVFATPQIPRAPFEGAPICTAAAADAAAAAGPLKKITFAWNAGAPCLVGVTVAKEKGFFAKHGLDVELVNYSGSTDQLLETLATGKADAAAGMALRWLKPMEQGFDVKIVASTHGGCLRLLAPTASNIKNLKDLKGKIIAVSDMNSPGKNFFAIRLKKVGLDPEKDVEFKQFPGPLLRVSVEKGEAHALADNDPLTFLFQKDGAFREISSNLDGEYASRVCCIIGVRGSLIRDDKPTAAAIARALIEASEYAAHHPEEAAATYAPYGPGKVELADLVTLAKYHSHHHHPVGADLKKELALYAEELKLVSIFKPSTDPAKFAERIYADVLS